MNETTKANVVQWFLGRETPHSNKNLHTTASVPQRDEVRKGAIAHSERNSLYVRERSFVDMLPWAEWLGEDGVFMLEDNRSCGAVYSIDPIGTEGRTEQFLADARSSIVDALQDSFDEHDVAPWVVQFYCFDEHDIDGHIDAMADYAWPHAKGTTYTNEYLGLLRRHYLGVSKPGGLFVDDQVTHTDWGARERRNYIVIYRKLPGKRAKRFNAEQQEFLPPVAALKENCIKLQNALSPLGIKFRQMRGPEFHSWMTRWFNPNPAFFGDDPNAFYREVSHSEDDMPFGNAFVESMFHSHPRSSFKEKAWVLDDTYTRCIKIDGIRKRPRIGHTTGELRTGDAINTMMDLLPDGAVMVQTIVVVPQDTVETHIAEIDRASFGDGSSSSQTRLDCETARTILGNRHKLYRAANCLYLFAKSIDALDSETNKARATLLQYGYKAVAVKDDKEALSNYMTFLPMAYEPDVDRMNNWPKAQLTWVQHIANASPLLGRGVGTGNPGIVAFNRGGEPLFFDPLSNRDRKKNGHMVLLGPTGAGKSATLVGMLAQVMAMIRPRLFIIEAGNSFGLLCDWYESLGLSVNRVRITPQSDARLSPFADSSLVVEQAEQLRRSISLEEDPFGVDDDDGEDTQRDVLGEMEIIALLMITGGEEKEAAHIRRSDKRLIRDAIIIACEKAHDEGRQALTQDVREGFYALAKEPERVPEVIKRLNEMGDAIGLFCDGFNGKVFNRNGEPWPESDVTIIDLGMFAREGYEAHLAISAISALNMINNIAERDQHLDRPILVTIDEAHIITTNPLLAPFLTKIVKMWRKLGAWLWSATQNMEDYPGAAKKMLNMVEWWVCLVMPKEEVDEIARFRSLTVEQKELLLSAKKAPRKYTEGVVLAEGIEALFRNVPPSLVLALAMTEKEEKAERFQIMSENGCSELDAAVEVGRRIDSMRGIDVTRDKYSTQEMVQ